MKTRRDAGINRLLGALLVAGSTACSTASPQNYDLVITNGRVMDPGGTDSKYFSAALAKNVYRFTPVRVESVKDTERWHGVNERVLVAEYAKSIAFYHQLLLNVEGL